MHVVQGVSLRWYNACANYAVSLAEGLHRIGTRSTVVGVDGSPAIEHALSGSCDIHALAGATRGNPLVFLRHVRECRSFALDSSVDCVNVHNGSDHVLWALALKGMGIPIIKTYGNQIPPNAHHGARLLMEKTAKVIATCKTAQCFFIDRFSIPPEDIPVINGGIDTERYVPVGDDGGVRDRLGIPRDAFVFGLLARFSPDKGHCHFFRAAGLAAQRFDDVRFIIAGWKSQYSLEDMKRMARDAGVADRTVFAGREPDGRNLISALDVGVIASVGSETICRIGMEYLAMKKPVIATDTNVVPEVILHGETGIVVPAGDFRSMAAAMIRMRDDTEFAQTCAAASRERAESEYSLESFARKTLDVYRSVINGG